MSGMVVEVGFANGSVEQAVFNPVPARGGRAVGPDGDWSLENLTTFIHTIDSPWDLSYTNAGTGKGAITRLSIDGFSKFVETGDPNNAVLFDRTTFNVGGSTLGSSGGRDFEVPLGTQQVTATYRNQVQSIAAGVPPVGDIYRNLDVTFDARQDTKWSQLPGRGVTGAGGVNIHSDVDERLVRAGFDRQAVADDFVSDGRPIVGVRWWGSYFNESNQPRFDDVAGVWRPVIEDAFALSFFEGDTATGSRPTPGDVLGVYVAPDTSVRITPTPLIGSDGHAIWQYEASLDQTVLEQASGFASPDAFLEEAGREYFLSVLATNGADYDLATGTRVFNNDPIEQGQWWGWHESFQTGTTQFPFLDDQAVASVVGRGGSEWVFPDWNPVSQSNMAFQLFAIDPSLIGLDGIDRTFLRFFQDTDNATVIPEPSAALLLAVGTLALVRRRR